MELDSYLELPPPSYDEIINGQSHAVNINSSFVNIDGNTSWGTQPSHTPSLRLISNFNAKQDNDSLQSAITTKDRDLVLQILCHRSNQQNQELSSCYNIAYDRSLQKDIKDKFGKRCAYSILMCGLSQPVHEFMARAVHNSMRNYFWLKHVMFLLPNEVRYDMKVYYKEKYGYDLLEPMNFHIKTQIQAGPVLISHQLIAAVNTRRDWSDEVKVQNILRDVHLMIHSERNANNYVNIQNLFLLRNFKHIRIMCREYERQSGKPIMEFLKCWYNFDKYYGLMKSVVVYSINPAAYLASVLHKSGSGLTTNTTLLSWIVLLRCEVDMTDIKNEYEHTYGVSLRSMIKSNTSGFYKYALYELIGECRSDKT